MQAFFQELQNQFRLADAIDIGVVSLLLYGLLRWFRERASRSLAIVIVGLVSLYLLARWLELYLTFRMFQLGFIAILLVLVVVFQHDIRLGFERLASLPLFRRPSSRDPSTRIVQTITEATAHLAQNRIGALLVFPGNDPLDRHVRGGVRVDAEISFPLLLSIFHPLTPGHDGAVLIAEERISQLGLHLPLSTNLSRVHGGGTRHAAALGLSECCDALVLAVSEERGTITLAQAGQLVAIEPGDTASHLRKYFEAHGPAASRRRPSLFCHLRTKLLALTLATSLWFLFAYHTDTVQRTIVIPIEYRNLPAGWVVEEPKATYAEVTLAGSEQAFELLDVAKVRVSLDVVDVPSGTMAQRVTESNLQNVPGELRVSQIIPSTVDIRVRKAD